MRYLIALGVALLLPLSASAAALALTPSVSQVVPGQVLTLALTAYPEGAHIASVEAVITYDPAVLEEISFTYAPGWLPLVETEYDNNNVTEGVVTKTAGYPGAIMHPTPFGTISFRARAPGQAAIIIAGKSLMLDAGSDNQFAGSAGGAVAVVAGTPPAPPSTHAPLKPAAAVPQAQTTASSSLVAAAAAIPSTRLLSLLLLGLLCFSGGALGTYALTRKSPGALVA